MNLPNKRAKKKQNIMGRQISYITWHIFFAQSGPANAKFSN